LTAYNTAVQQLAAAELAYDNGGTADALDATIANSAADVLADAQAAYAAELINANATAQSLALKLADVVTAQEDLDAAIAADEAAQALVDAKVTARNAAQATLLTKTDAATAAAAASSAASSAANTASSAASSALGALNTALAANTDLVDVLAELEVSTSGQNGFAVALTDLETDADAAALAAADAAEELAVASAELTGLQRQDSILTAAAASNQQNIALASGALTGDEAAANSNFETEVLGALTNHETRITENTADIAVLETGLVAEAAARVAGDAATLTSANTFTTAAVAAEATIRAAADTALTTRIAAEETARAAADTALGARITAENSARVAADNALGARITDLDNTLRDKIASSTATAIAMGGSTILPDTNFTLSGNVGMYEGASAVALNAAGRVSEKVYVTAAVGGGLNKGGKLGGRVGVVFGF
jgi:hypothetical protein